MLRRLQVVRYGLEISRGHRSVAAHVVAAGLRGVLPAAVAGIETHRHIALRLLAGVIRVHRDHVRQDRDRHCNLVRGSVGIGHHHRAGLLAGLAGVHRLLPGVARIIGEVFLVGDTVRRLGFLALLYRDLLTAGIILVGVAFRRRRAVLGRMGHILRIAGRHGRIPARKGIPGIRGHRRCGHCDIGRFGVHIVRAHPGQGPVIALRKGHRHVPIRLLHRVAVVIRARDHVVQLCVLGRVGPRRHGLRARRQLGAPQLRAGLGLVAYIRRHHGRRYHRPGLVRLHIVGYLHLGLATGVLPKGAALAGVEDHAHVSVRRGLAVVCVVRILRVKGLLRILRHHFNDGRQRAINGIYRSCLINRRGSRKPIDCGAGIDVRPVGCIGQSRSIGKRCDFFFCRQLFGRPAQELVGAFYRRFSRELPFDKLVSR